jgi:hypothetical protein
MEQVKEVNKKIKRTVREGNDERKKDKKMRKK